MSFPIKVVSVNILKELRNGFGFSCYLETIEGMGSPGSIHWIFRTGLGHADLPVENR